MMKEKGECIAMEDQEVQECEIRDGRWNRR
jgi:hypothetical protein